MADYPVATYRVTLGRVRLPGMNNDPGTWPMGGIRCSQQAGQLLDIAFMPTGVALPVNTSNANHHVLYRPESEMPLYLDLLRNERPVHMTIDPAQPAKHQLSTTDAQPVGWGRLE